MKKITINNLKIDENLIKFINDEAIPGTGLDSNHFWKEFSNVVHELAPKNKNLIKKEKRYKKKLTTGICQTRIVHWIKINIPNS